MGNKNIKQIQQDPKIQFITTGQTSEREFIENEQENFESKQDIEGASKANNSEVAGEILRQNQRERSFKISDIHLNSGMIKSRKQSTVNLPYLTVRRKTQQQQQQFLSLQQRCLQQQFSNDSHKAGEQDQNSVNSGSNTPNTRKNGDQNKAKKKSALEWAQAVQNLQKETEKSWSLLRALGVMVTIVYYLPNSQIEVVFTLFIILATTVVIGYAVTTIGTILQNISDKNSKFKKEMQVINKFLIKHHIKISLRTRVEKYIEYIHEQEKDKNKEEDEFVINRLSGELRNEVIRSLSNSDKNNQFEVLKKNFESSTINELILHVKQLNFGKNETIFKKSEKENHFLYVIIKGKVQLYFERDLTYKKMNEYEDVSFTQDGSSEFKKLRIDTQTLHEGQTFGQFSFFTGFSKEISARCVENCTLYYIERSKFLQIVSDRPKELEKFCYIRDQLIEVFHQRTTSNVLLKQIRFDHIKYSCVICQQAGHLPDYCPELHYIPDKQAVIRDQYVRRQFIRKRKKINALFNFYDHDIKIEEEDSFISSESDQVPPFVALKKTLSTAPETVLNQLVPQEKYQGPLKRYHSQQKTQTSNKLKHISPYKLKNIESDSNDLVTSQDSLNYSPRDKSHHCKEQNLLQVNFRSAQRQSNLKKSCFNLKKYKEIDNSDLMQMSQKFLSENNIKQIRDINELKATSSNVILNLKDINKEESIIQKKPEKQSTVNKANTNIKQKENSAINDINFEHTPPNLQFRNNHISMTFNTPQPNSSVKPPLGQGLMSPTKLKQKSRTINIHENNALSFDYDNANDYNKKPSKHSQLQQKSKITNQKSIRFEGDYCDNNNNNNNNKQRYLLSRQSSVIQNQNTDNGSYQSGMSIHQQLVTGSGNKKGVLDILQNLENIIKSEIRQLHNQTGHFSQKSPSKHLTLQQQNSMETFMSASSDYLEDINLGQSINIVSKSPQIQTLEKIEENEEKQKKCHRRQSVWSTILENKQERELMQREKQEEVETNIAKSIYNYENLLRRHQNSRKSSLVPHYQSDAPPAVDSQSHIQHQLISEKDQIIEESMKNELIQIKNGLQQINPEKLNSKLLLYIVQLIENTKEQEFEDQSQANSQYYKSFSNKDFDKIKQYKIYYPHYNSSVIFQNLKLSRQQKRCFKQIFDIYSDDGLWMSKTQLKELMYNLNTKLLSLEQILLKKSKSNTFTSVSQSAMINETNQMRKGVSPRNISANNTSRIDQFLFQECNNQARTPQHRNPNIINSQYLTPYNFNDVPKQSIQNQLNSNIQRRIEKFAKQQDNFIDLMKKMKEKQQTEYECVYCLLGTDQFGKIRYNDFSQVSRYLKSENYTDRLLDMFKIDEETQGVNYSEFFKILMKIMEIIDEAKQPNYKQKISQKSIEFQLSEKQIAEFRYMFSLFDKNGDEKIQVKELRRVMKTSLGRILSDQDVLYMMQQAGFAQRNNMADEKAIYFYEFVKILSQDLKQPELTVTQINEYRDAFTTLEECADEKIAVSQIPVLFSSPDFPQFNNYPLFSQIEINRIVDDLKYKKNVKFIDLDTYLQIIASKIQEIEQDEIQREAFHIFSSNSNSITKIDLQDKIYAIFGEQYNYDQVLQIIKEGKLRVSDCYKRKTMKQQTQLYERQNLNANNLQVLELSRKMQQQSLKSQLLKKTSKISHNQETEYFQQEQEMEEKEFKSLLQ